MFSIKYENLNFWLFWKQTNNVPINLWQKADTNLIAIKLSTSFEISQI